MEIIVQKKIWWKYIDEDLKELVLQAVELDKKVDSWQQKFNDYSFIVFPAAKAYEGFLKKVFLDAGFITEEEYFGKHFRIGKALNPSLDPRLRGESVYDKIATFCGGKELANKMWNTWRECRNLLFHWFPNEKNNLTHSQAGERVRQIIMTMDEVFKGCKIN